MICGFFLGFWAGLIASVYWRVPVNKEAWRNRPEAYATLWERSERR